MREIAGMSVLITAGGSGIGAACLAVTGDITRASDRERIVSEAVRHGGGPHALINNAGNMFGTDGGMTAWI